LVQAAFQGFLIFRVINSIHWNYSLFSFLKDGYKNVRKKLSGYQFNLTYKKENKPQAAGGLNIVKAMLLVSYY
jgi:hypothetical protein